MKLGNRDNKTCPAPNPKVKNKYNNDCKLQTQQIDHKENIIHQALPSPKD